jgi:hypothetical protein
VTWCLVKHRGSFTLPYFTLPKDLEGGSRCSFSGNTLRRETHLLESKEPITSCIYFQRWYTLKIVIIP